MLWSVVICTRNRSRDLRACLQALERLRHAPGQFEILVVDNCSSDDTSEVVADAAARNPAVVYLREEKLGLSHARNLGLSKARGELVAFMDDDAWPEPDWLDKLSASFADQGIGCVGGKVLPLWRDEGRWPEWLHQRLIVFFTVVDYGYARELHYPDYPAGTNIAFRKNALSTVGGFSHQLGRTGESLLSMEEVDICLRLEEAGFRVAYSPEAVVHHTVHQERLTREWIKDRSYWQGISGAIIERERMSAAFLAIKVSKYIVFLAGAIAGAVVFRLLKDEKTAFFCRCQATLCSAYLGKLLSRSKR